MAGSVSSFNPLAIAAPDLYAKQLAIARRQSLGQALLQGGMQDAGSGAFGGIRNAGNSMLGALLLRNSDKDMGALYAPQDQGGRDTGQISNSAPPLPAQPQPAQPQMTGDYDPEGNPVFAASQAQPQQSAQVPQQAQPYQQFQGLGQPQQPQGRPKTIPEALASMVVPIPGMTRSASMQFYLTDPGGYYKALAAATAPTPDQRNTGAAYGPGTEGAQTALRGIVDKAGAIQATRGMTRMPDGSMFFAPPAPPAGYQYVQGPYGQPVLVPTAGGSEAVAGSAFAGNIGKAAVTPATGYDANNMPVASNQAVMSGNAGAVGQLIPGAGQSAAPLGIRSNNPGNLQPGGREATYGTAAEGVIRAASNLDNYAARGINTLAGIASTWAPQAAGNDPQAYAGFLSQRLGVPANQPLNLHDPNVKGKVLDAIFAFENGPRAMGQAGGQQQAGPLRPELPQGQGSYMQSQGKDAAERHDATVAAAAESPMRINVLDNIIGLSSSGVATGPGQDWQNRVLGYAANSPVLSKVMGGAKDNVAKFQELQKFTYQNAIRNWQAAGGTGTDAQMESMAHANPNDHLFPQALQQIARWGKAAELAVQGKANAQDRFLAQNGNTPTAQIQFENNWRNSFDPKVFQYSLMSPQEKQGFAATLKTPQAAQAFLSRQQQLRALGAVQ